MEKITDEMLKEFIDAMHELDAGPVTYARAGELSKIGLAFGKLDLAVMLLAAHKEIMELRAFIKTHG